MANRKKLEDLLAMMDNKMISRADVEWDTDLTPIHGKVLGMGTHFPNKYLSKEDLDFIIEKYELNEVTEHDDTCWKKNDACMIDKLLRVIQNLKADLDAATAYDYRSYAPPVWNRHSCHTTP